MDVPICAHRCARSHLGLHVQLYAVMRTHSLAQLPTLAAAVGGIWGFHSEGVQREKPLSAQPIAGRLQPRV